MSVDPYMERVQRRVLDDAGHADVPVEQSVAQGGPLPARPMFAEKDGCEWISHSFTLDRDTDVFFGPSPILPSVDQYEQVATAGQRAASDSEWELPRDIVIDEYAECLRKLARLVRGIPSLPTRPRHTIGAAVAR